MRRSTRIFAAFALFFSTLTGGHAALDISPADGLPDIWAMVNGVGSISPSADDDGDGQTNGAEAIAGTNPKVSTDSIRIKSISKSGTNVTLVFPGVGGKRYEVQGVADLGGTFAPLAQPSVHQPTADGDITAVVAAGPARFFRVVVSDLDTDGDGLTNYEERMVGLNPSLPDSNNDGTSDLAYVSAELALPDTVKIRAVETFASEDGPASGVFEVTRSRSLFGITVPYSVSGTATPATDYLALSGSTTLAQGVTLATVSVNPNTEAPNVLEGGESVTVTLLPPSTGPTLYALGNPSTATIIIGETAVPTGTGLLARYYDHANATYDHAANFGDAGNYAFTRGTPNTTGTIVVTPTTGNFSALQNGNLVKLSFNGGNLNTAAFNHANYSVTAKTGTTFTVSINSATALPTSSSSTCNYSIQSFTHPAVIERVDPTVNFEWMGGTANANVITPGNSPDNYSSAWEGYLSPSTAGNYTFQLDADDKARVLLDTGSGLTQILEHGWDSAATLGTFKQSAPIALAVPASSAQRYKIRVEHVETTGEARCRLQWSRDGGAFANIPQANVFTHTAAMSANYTYTRNVDLLTGSIVVTLNGHTFAVNDLVTLAFSSGNLFTPPANYHGIYTVTAVAGSTFTVAIAGAGLPASGTGAGFVLNQPASTTTGWFNQIFANTSFTAPPGRVGVDNSGATTSNNGLYGIGSPDPSLIAVDTFSIRWTGQIQPQFTEEYTFVVHADEGCALKINGQVQQLRSAASTDQSGSTYIYDPVTGNTVVTYTNMAVKAGSYVVGETVRLNPTSGNLNYSTGATYNYDAGTGDLVVNYSAMANFSPNGFTVGETVFLDPTSGNLSALGSLPYPITAAGATTFTINVGAGLFSSGSGAVTISDTKDLAITAVTATTFTVNHGIGKHPASSGNTNAEIINKPLKDWASMANERYVRIPLVGGVRYDIQLDYWDNTGFSRCILYWYSPSQPKQVIPSNRLYPSSAGLAPASYISPTEATALVGGAFSHPVAGSNGAAVAVSGNPAWLTYSGGALVGTPPAGAGGDYQVVITLTSAVGTGTSVLNLHVDENAGNVTREFWNGVTGNTIASIPTGIAPSGSGTLSSLEAPTDFGDNYGARIRGYITAPETGNYYFWIAANNAAELWISNDAETVNNFKRAWVTAGSPTPQTWNGAAKQQSPWLALEQGRKYYFEILHKAGAGAGDNLAIGWLKPSQTGTAPSEIVPGYVLSPYIPPAPGSTPGTLYLATMLSQSGAVTKGVGSSTLRLSEDESYVDVKFSYSGLTGALTDWHIHNDPYLTHGSSIMYDPNAPPAGSGPQPDSTPNLTHHKWVIPQTVGTMTKAEVVELLKQGKAYINLHTAMYLNGEIRGNYTLANGTRTFTPPPPAPSWTDDHTSNNGASRFLAQTTFGANTTEIAALKAMTSYEAWIDDQFTKPITPHLPEVLAREIADVFGPFDVRVCFNTWWKNSISAPDQLRQRIAFALSEIHVVSGQGPLEDNSRAISHFYDTLLTGAFGNFSDILRGTTLTPGMGRYLDMLRNDKQDLSIGRIPNENYAREIKQLFSIGLFRMWPDGTLILNSQDAPIDTYTQREIVGLAHVFTGWDYGYDGVYRTAFGATADWTRPMREIPTRHDTGPKRVLNNEVIPGLSMVGGQVLDPDSTHNSTVINDAAYQALPVKEFDEVHNMLFNHPNTGPFICRQLIQRLVTSHPSRDYLYRVVQKFNDNGSGVRGDMKSVIKAILLDYEARSTTPASGPAYGKQREPVLRVAQAARAFRPTLVSGSYAQTGTNVITITTGAAHLLTTSNNVFLEFTDTTGDPAKPAPPTGTYRVQSVPTNTTYTINAPGWITGTYNQPANSSVMTITLGGHWLPAGGQAYLDFTSGAASGLAGFDAMVKTVVLSTAVDFPGGSGNNSGTTFTIAGISPTTASARSGNVMIARFFGTYQTISGTYNIDTVYGGAGTYGTMADHHLNVGNNVFLNFVTTRDTTSGDPTTTENDLVYPITAVPDLNTFTVAARNAPNAAINSDNNVYIFPLQSQPLVRSGTVNERFGTFTMDNTDLDLTQTPLNSPTVFNFFLPDYKFAGTLASQGITTPEFETTSETTVVRQANFLYNGIFNPDITTGMSSFKAGTDSLVMDFSPWMGVATGSSGVGLVLGAGPQPGQVWTSNANLPTLIDRLNTLLLAGQLPAAAKASIQNFLYRTMSSISIASPCVITSTAHGLVSGDTITISGVTGGSFTPSINGSFTVTVTDANTFTVPVNHSATTPTLTSAHFSPIAYNNSAPSTTNIRDRLRAIIHLILTSPDYTVQQ
jgi:uncharacterized protein (DUF1800 family)